MEELLLKLLHRLEAMGERDESLFDTEVREAMGMAVFRGFIKPTPGYVLPGDYGMSEEDNHAIRAALAEYIEAAKLLAPQLGITTFHQRLAAFQNSSVQTTQGAIWNDYDEFFGTSDPSLFDAEGNLLRRR